MNQQTTPTHDLRMSTEDPKRPTERKFCVSCGHVAMRAERRDDWEHESDRDRTHPANVVELDHEERMCLADWWTAYDSNHVVGPVALESLVDDLITDRLLSNNRRGMATLEAALTIALTRASQHNAKEVPGLEAALRVVDSLKH